MIERTPEDAEYIESLLELEDDALDVIINAMKAEGLPWPLVHGQYRLTTDIQLAWKRMGQLSAEVAVVSSPLRNPIAVFAGKDFTPEVRQAFATLLEAKAGRLMAQARRLAS